ncbi:MAG: epoxyqueuosine reductase QueH [Lachnospiraceae bacterium]|nr:epoxyqueuosine reductase QueH [Lachnospiraceae bacterium]
MENKINYQKELEKEIKKWSELEVCPTILLHSCCAPCSSYCLEYLSKYAKITAFYYNPNITDENEYRHRVSELKRLIEEMFPERNETIINGDVTTNGMEKRIKPRFLEGTYDPDSFYNIAKGLENELECGRRCIKCYELRLRKTAEEAVKGGYDYFTTTLTISPLKDAQVLNRLGIKLGEEYGVKYLPSDFKKNGGYQRSIELSKEYKLYRQNYCGCEYSKAAGASAQDKTIERAEDMLRLQAH